MNTAYNQPIPSVCPARTHWIPPWQVTISWLPRPRSATLSLELLNCQLLPGIVQPHGQPHAGRPPSFPDATLACRCIATCRTRRRCRYGQFHGGGPLSVNSILSPTTYQVGDDVSLCAEPISSPLASRPYNTVPQRPATLFTGSFTFGGVVTGNAMADFLLGDLSSFTQGGPMSCLRENYVSSYAQDTWSDLAIIPQSGIALGAFIPADHDQGAIIQFQPGEFHQVIKHVSQCPSGLHFPHLDLGKAA